jgi:hypothetical protein
MIEKYPSPVYMLHENSTSKNRQLSFVNLTSEKLLRINREARAQRHAAKERELVSLVPITHPANEWTTSSVIEEEGEKSMGCKCFIKKTKKIKICDYKSAHVLFGWPPIQPS